LTYTMMHGSTKLKFRQNLVLLMAILHLLTTLSHDRMSALKGGKRIELVEHSTEKNINY
jgi:hypothetical protein